MLQQCRSEETHLAFYSALYIVSHHESCIVNSFHIITNKLCSVVITIFIYNCSSQFIQEVLNKRESGLKNLSEVVEEQQVENRVNSPFFPLKNSLRHSSIRYNHIQESYPLLKAVQ